MFAWDPQFQESYATVNPLRVAASSYTNETNVAQARPLESIGVLAPGGGLVGTDQQWRPQPTSGPTPTNPAAPMAYGTADAATLKAYAPQNPSNPVVWIGLAAGILVILWAMR